MAIPAIVGFILKGLAMIIIGELIRPKPKIEDPKPSSLGDFGFPTATEGRTIPVAWGTVDIKGPNVTWYGDLETIAIKKKQKTGLWSSTRVTVGYRYYIGAQLALCHGEVDEFIGIRVDEKDVKLSGKNTLDGVTSFQLNDPELFGKVDEQGGLTGQCRFYHGTALQAQNDYMRSVLAEPEIPTYRGVCHLMFEHVLYGNTGRFEAPSIIIRRTPNQLGLTGGRHNINGNANPACMVYEVLTNRRWGMGIPASLIDVDSFVAAGNALAAQGWGLSMLVESETDGKSLIFEIMRQIDGIVFSDLTTGKLRMRLVRDDYAVSTLPWIDTSNVLSGSLEFSRASWDDTINTVKVKYVDREQNFTERVIQHQELGNIATRGGTITSDEYDYTGISNAQQANEMAARVLKVVSSPLARVSWQMKRTGTPIYPGDVLRLKWPERDLEQMIVRVTDVDYGTLDDPAVKIEAIEDVFSVGATAYIPPNPSGWENPFVPPQPAPMQRLLEAPYAFYGDLGAGAVVMTVAAKPGRQEVGYRVLSSTDGSEPTIPTADVPDFTPAGNLLSAYTGTLAPDDAGFTIYAGNGVSPVVYNAGERSAGAGLALIDDEILAFSAIEDLGSGNYQIKGVVCGALDTVPRRHSAGAAVYILSDGFGTTQGVPYTAGVSVRAKLLPYTRIEPINPSLVTEMTLTTDLRHQRPYPPAAVRTNGAFAPVGGTLTGGFTPLTISWEPRDRGTAMVETSRVLPQNTTGVPAEAGVTWTLELYGETDELKRTVGGIPAGTTSYTWVDEETDCGLTTTGELFLAEASSLVHWTGLNGATAVVSDTGESWAFYGDAQISTAQYESAPSALRLSGAGYVDCADYGIADFWDDDWCVELFFRPDALAVDPQLLIGNYSTHGFSLAITAGGTIFANVRNDETGLIQIVGGSSVNVAGWNHAALARVGNTVCLWLNGSVEGFNNAFIGPMDPPNAAVRIGQTATGAWPFSGYIDETRLSVGKVYEVGLGITVPATPLALKSGLAYAVDPDFSSVRSLLAFDDEDGTANVADIKGLFWNRVGTGAVSHASPMFGPGCYQQFGTPSYLWAEGPALDVAQNSASWTAELWVRPGNFDAPRGILQFGDIAENLNRVSLLIGTAGEIVLDVVGSTSGDTANVATPTGVLALGEYRHVVLQYDAGAFKVFVEGAQEATVAYSGTMLGVPRLNLGAAYGTPSIHFYGQLDDFRLSDIARYPGTAYTVPSVANPPSGPGPRLNMNGRYVLRAVRGGLASYQEHDIPWTRSGVIP